MSSVVLSQPLTGDNKNYFFKEILALKLFGFSLTGYKGVLYKLYAFFILFPFLFLYPLLDFYEYFKHDFSVIADMVVAQTAAFTSLCKAIVLYRNRDRITKIMIKLGQEPFTPNLARGGPVEEKLVKECVWMTSAQAWVYWLFGILFVFSTFVYTVTVMLVSDDYLDRKFPYGPFTVLNTTYSPNYEISVIYQGLSIVICGNFFITIDLMLASVLAHISYQFKILQNYIAQLVETSYKKMIKDKGEGQFQTSSQSAIDFEVDGTIVPWKYLKKSVKRAVEYHLAIFNIANEIEEVFSILLLMEFLGTLALLCFSIYSASLVDQGIQQVARHVGEGMCACMQVATVCYWGEQVVQESQKVGRAVYKTNFVGTDLRFQKAMALIVRRSQNPTKLTAGKFADVCATTFAWILRTSYSAFMVLRKSN